MKPNMVAMEALSYVGFSPLTRSFMFTCYVKTAHQGDWNRCNSGPPCPPYLGSLFAQSVTGRSHSIYIYIYIYIDKFSDRQSGITQDENTSYFIEVLQICFVWQVFNLPHSSGEIWWKITFANSLFVIHVKNTQQICNPLSSWIESLVYVKLNASILITTHVYFRMP